MSFFLYPTPKKPQFYFTDKPNVFNYFIEHFFYVRKPELQFLITMLKLLVPNLFIRSLMTLIMTKEHNLPAQILEEIDNLIEFIKKNSSIFPLSSNDHTSISFIIRNSKWHRINDKFVVIFFSGNDSKPFTIAKVGYTTSDNSIIKEYKHLKLVHHTFKNNDQLLIPEPIALHSSHKTITYFERVIDGIPFNDYQKLSVRKKKFHDLHIDILAKCKNMLIALHLQNNVMTQNEFSKYFYEPIDSLNNKQFEEIYQSKLSQLQNEIHDLEKVPLPSVWMHGDFWLGSILYNSEKVGFIDWEFFSERGVPLWDYFSLIFHIGIRIDYFTDTELSRIVDTYLLDLAEYCQIEAVHIQTLFQSFLLYNMHTRDTSAETYWQKSLERYWNAFQSTGNKADRLL
jgi:hypothetical protein